MICICNEGAEDLVLCKVYRVLQDKKATNQGFLRIVDESGEDYLYPSDLFMTIELPRPVRRALTAVS